MLETVFLRHQDLSPSGTVKGRKNLHPPSRKETEDSTCLNKRNKPNGITGKSSGKVDYHQQDLRETTIATMNRAAVGREEDAS